MPKISAKNLEEHRENQVGALVQAAGNLILEEGLEALSFEKIAKKAKLARSSVYEYFPSKSDVVLAVMAREADDWQSGLQKALSDASTPLEAIESFLRLQLGNIAEGKHRLGFILMNSTFDLRVREKSEEIHQKMFSLVLPHLQRLAVKDAQACTSLIAGSIFVASKAMAQSPKPRSLINPTIKFIIGGVRSMAER